MDEHIFDNIEEVDLKKTMETSYIDYAMSVIASRALPDVRDGLKPVHRRILYTLHENGLTPEKAYRKCADTVGAVLGRYHPHGDAAVYDALVRLAQDFSMRYVLVDGHGNFGSIDGDPPAAYRYTEAKMAKLTLDMMTDIGKDTVDFAPNYDDRLKEPVVLPSRFPNLLVNGSTGIAVGMATNIPPHNLREVVNAVVKNARASEKAYICLKTSWLISNYIEELLKGEEDNQDRIAKLKEQRASYEKNAYEGFVTAMANEGGNICGMDRWTLTYLVAYLALKSGDRNYAAKALSDVLVARDAKESIKDKARTLKELLTK